jgi:hypothetical protein
MGAPEIIMARRQIEIDRDKLRAAIRQLPHEYAFYMLDDAIDLLSPAQAAQSRQEVPLKKLNRCSGRT